MDTHGAGVDRLFRSDYPLITEKDRIIIACQDNNTLIKWANMISCWEWPKELPGHPNGEYTYKPKQIKIFGLILWRSCIRNTREHQIIKYITNIIGDKLILRAGNNHMTNEQFEYFWTQPYDKYSNKYYKK
jgi:hypothetical protein